MLPRLSYRVETTDGLAVRVAGGRVAAPDGPCDHAVTLPPGVLRPGLINAHDHLHRNHYPRLGWPPYEDAYAWGRDIHRRARQEIERAKTLPRRDAMLFGALKNLMSGVTTVVHHDAWHPMLDEKFPLRVARTRMAHSLGAGGALPEATPVEQPLPFCIHLAEGVTDAMADEVGELDRRGLLDEHLIAVHAVGVDTAGAARLAAARAAVVWCPTSNAFLFGRTASGQLLRSGVDVLLGSDSLLTAAGTLLDELRAARRLALMDDRSLLAAVGEVAARRLGLPVPILEPGAPADLAHFTASPLEATAADVSLVVVGGEPRYGDSEHAGLFDAAGVQTELISVGGAEKLVARPLGSVARTVRREWPEAARVFG